MGDVVRLSEVRASRPSRRAAAEAPAEGTIALFTGVRIERWSEDESGPDETHRTRPTQPRRRRRRT